MNDRFELNRRHFLSGCGAAVASTFLPAPAMAKLPTDKGHIGHEPFVGVGQGAIGLRGTARTCSPCPALKPAASDDGHLAFGEEVPNGDELRAGAAAGVPVLWACAAAPPRRARQMAPSRPSKRWSSSRIGHSVAGPPPRHFRPSRSSAPSSARGSPCAPRCP